MTTVLFAARDAQWVEYEPHLRAGFAAEGVDVQLTTEVADPATVDYIIYSPANALQDFRPYTNAKAVLSLWAGVEEIVGNTTLTQPLCRMVDPGLTEGMVEWVVGHAMRHHLGMDTHIHGQDGAWRGLVAPPLARNRKVAVLGLGALGAACAEALAALRFQVAGWSRREKQIDGVTCFSGDDGLKKALSGAEICILLTPSTPATENLLNAQTLSLLAEEAYVINPGRGPLIDDDALLSALDSGQLAHATLDVFRVEPLPVDHPFWAHPKVIVTPHIASVTRAETAALSVVENIVGHLRGEPLRNLVDRDAGY